MSPDRQKRLQSSPQGYGGHIMCMPGSQCRIAGAMAYRMGQENKMGRRLRRAYKLKAQTLKF